MCSINSGYPKFKVQLYNCIFFCCSMFLRPLKRYLQLMKRFQIINGFLKGHVHVASVYIRIWTINYKVYAGHISVGTARFFFSYNFSFLPYKVYAVFSSWATFIPRKQASDIFWTFWPFLDCSCMSWSRIRFKEMATVRLTTLFNNLNEFFLL